MAPFGCPFAEARVCLSLLAIGRGPCRPDCLRKSATSWPIIMHTDRYLFLHVCVLRCVEGSCWVGLEGMPKGRTICWDHACSRQVFVAASVGLFHHFVGGVPQRKWRLVCCHGTPTNDLLVARVAFLWLRQLQDTACVSHKDRAHLQPLRPERWPVGCFSPRTLWASEMRCFWRNELH